MTQSRKAKPFKINKREVWKAYKRVKTNRGAAGIDGETLKDFEKKESRNLYRLWNRMSSGSYFPKGVLSVEIPKANGKTRTLGIPTVTDRIAQEVVRARLEPEVEPIFHKDSYGYRPGKSAIDAVRSCRERNWTKSWVLDVDIENFFGTINHELLMKAVEKHATEKWQVLYIQRWLATSEGGVGIPQGGVISPLLANLYLHYAFDNWMEKRYPYIQFERYADDVIMHCASEEKARKLQEELSKRLLKCGLRLHPEKTKIVRCSTRKLKRPYPNVSYTFLGYYFRPRAARLKTGVFTTVFTPAVSPKAEKAFRQKLKGKNFRRLIGLSFSELADFLNPMIRGWYEYFGHFRRSALTRMTYYIERRLSNWIKRKYKVHTKRSVKLLNYVRKQEPNLFAHWVNV